MMRVALLVLCACNQVFGVKDTRQVDARFFDAPADAAWGCPPLGQPPVLDPQLHQDILQWCMSYSIAGGHAVASCHEPSDFFDIYEGAPDQTLAPAPGVPANAGDDVYDQPRLSSDGSELYVRHYNYSTNVQETLMYTRGAGGAWVPGTPPPFGQNANDNQSTIVAGSTGDRTFISNNLAIEEWVHEATGWRDAGSIPIASLLPTQAVGLNPIDPLRLLVSGYDRHTYYTDRLDVGSPYRSAIRITELPDYASDAAMTPDCGRVYIAGLHSIFYVRQP